MNGYNAKDAASEGDESHFFSAKEAVILYLYLKTGLLCFYSAYYIHNACTHPTHIHQVFYLFFFLVHPTHYFTIRPSFRTLKEYLIMIL